MRIFPLIILISALFFSCSKEDKIDYLELGYEVTATVTPEDHIPSTNTYYGDYMCNIEIPNYPYFAGQSGLTKVYYINGRRYNYYNSPFTWYTDDGYIQWIRESNNSATITIHVYQNKHGVPKGKYVLNESEIPDAI